MEAPKVGDEVTFRCGLEIVRGHVVELKQLHGGVSGRVPTKTEHWALGLVMLETGGALLRGSREFLADEGLYWARGWSGPSADALRAAVLLQTSASDAT